MMATRSRSRSFEPRVVRRRSDRRSSDSSCVSIPQSKYDEDGSVSSVPIVNRDFLVSSKGDINASFSVPGLISIPSDDDSHNVTIVELLLDASMSWISIPKKDTKAHLTVSKRWLLNYKCDWD